MRTAISGNTAIRLLRLIKAYITGEKFTARNLYATETTVNYFVPGFAPNTLLAELAEAGAARRVDPPRASPSRKEGESAEK